MKRFDAVFLKRHFSIQLGRVNMQHGGDSLRQCRRIGRIAAACHPFSELLHSLTQGRFAARGQNHDGR